MNAFLWVCVGVLAAFVGAGVYAMILTAWLVGWRNALLYGLTRNDEYLASDK